MLKKEAIERSIKIGALLSTKEKEALWDLANKAIQKKGVAIEIGTWQGGSAAIIGEVCKAKEATLIGIDYFRNNITGYIPFDKVLDNLKGLPVNFLVGNSKEVHDYLRDGMADFIFIDGDHSFVGVKMDIINYIRKLKPNGIFCGHDYTGPYGVKEAVDQIFGRENIDLIDSIWIKKTYNDQRL